MITCHFLDVGQGNMAVLIMPDNFVVVCDCNITNDNEASVFAYLARVVPSPRIGVFINTHRDADHMRGIRKLHAKYPIGRLYDSGVSGNTDTVEYQQYMELRRTIPCYEVSDGTYIQAYPFVRILNGKRAGLSEINAQSIVIHVNHNGSSLLLAGDSDVEAWLKYIMQDSTARVKSLVLYASHHGSHSFFNADADKYYDYIKHIAAINPAITIISVGDGNPHGHPDPLAVAQYEKYSYGTVESGQKIFRTDKHGNMKLELHGQGTGTIYWNQ